MFRLNYISRQFPSPAHGGHHLEGMPSSGGGSYLQSPLQISPVLMSNTSETGGSVGGRNDPMVTSRNEQMMTSSLSHHKSATLSSYPDPSWGDEHRRPSSGDHQDPTASAAAAFLQQARQKQHAAFGAMPFHFFRHGAGGMPSGGGGDPPTGTALAGIPYPQLFTQLQQSFLRNQLDAAVVGFHPRIDAFSAAAALNQAGIDSRRLTGALFGGGHAQPDRSDLGAAYAQSLYHHHGLSRKDERFEDAVGKECRRLDTVGSSAASVDALDRRIKACRGDVVRRGVASSVASGMDGERRSTSPAVSSYTGSDQISDHVGDRITPMDEDSPSKGKIISLHFRTVIVYSLYIYL